MTSVHSISGRFLVFAELSIFKEAFVASSLLFQQLQVCESLRRVKGLQSPQLESDNAMEIPSGLIQLK